MMSETPLAATSQEGPDEAGHKLDQHESGQHESGGDAAPAPSTSLPATLSEDDYDAIASAVMETERGRWFLKEYARRNRHTDTQVVLDALTRLEDRIDAAPTAKGDDASVALLSHNVIDLAEAITQVKREVQDLGAQGDTPDNFTSATSELEAIVSQTETATGEILEAAEKVQEVVWTLREEGASETQCDIIESKIIDIYTACSFQDLTGQRSNKVVRLVGYVEKRVASMMEILGLSDAEPRAASLEKTGDMASYQEGDTRSDAHLLHGPGMDGEINEQGDVDALFGTADEPMDVLAALPTDELQTEELTAEEPATEEPAPVEHSAPEPSQEAPADDEPLAEEALTETSAQADIFTDDDVVEIHDAEMLRGADEEALMQDALSSAPAPDILDVELLDFHGPDMAAADDSNEGAVLHAMSDFAVDSNEDSMFVDDLVTADTADLAVSNAPVFAEDIEAAPTPSGTISSADPADITGQDIFDVEDFDLVLDVTESDDEPTSAESEEQLDASMVQVAAQMDEPVEADAAPSDSQTPPSDLPDSMPLAHYTEEERVALFS